jgi:hypothetical protein
MPFVSTLHLIQRHPDLRTIAALERLLDLAKTGSLIGLAYIALEPGAYSSDILGPVCGHALLARGICRELEDLVTK